MSRAPPPKKMKNFAPPRIVAATARLVTLGVLASVLAVPRIAAAASYYVATTGSPGAAGNNNNAGTTAAAPFATVARALQAVQAGDTIFLRSGTYGAISIGLRNGV